ncbi:MAG TPA: polysaccharide biosynthesis tyrosine autokinase [Vicinamibacterales bacterium]|nr:polysaccharide biosynthesis tyrosine autokinase [Vicinamibacterales bacterium]
MSRIQNILEKAEREGAALRTSRVGAVAPPAPNPSVAASVPITIDIPTPSHRASGVDVDGSAPAAAMTVTPAPPAFPGTTHAGAMEAAVPQTPIIPAAAAVMATTPINAAGADDIEQVTARLNPVLIAGLSPQSLAAEQYRALRTRLAHTEGAAMMRTVMVTSPQKGEGKSVTSANLALTMAQELQRRVVIVEADLRKPSLGHLFNLPAGPGLAEFLVGAAELKDVMKFLPDHHLTVIPAGTPPANPSELLGSTAMRRLLDQLRTRFDRVILDTPPVLPLADVAVLAPMVDGALLVVRAGYTPKPAIENALRAFDSSRLLGIVLNESGMEQDYRYEAPRH